MRIQKIYRVFVILIAAFLCISAIQLVNFNPIQLSSAQTTLIDDSPIDSFVSETQFTANVTEDNYTVVAVRSSDMIGGELTLSLFSDSSYSTVVDSVKYANFDGFAFIAYNGKGLASLKTNYYGISYTIDWDEIIIEMENGMNTGLDTLTFPAIRYGDFQTNEIIDTYIIDLTPDITYDFRLNSAYDYDLYLAATTEYCNIKTTLARSDLGTDKERILGSVSEPGRYCMIVTNPHGTTGAYDLSIDAHPDDKPYKVTQPEATTKKFAWDIYKDSYSVIGVKALDSTGGVFKLTSYVTNDYQTEKRAVEFTGNAGLLYIITGGFGLESKSTEYYSISSSTWETTVIEMENGQATSMNPVLLDTEIYSDMNALEIIDTYILNLTSDTMFNISLDVPFDADLDMHLAGPTSGGARSNSVELVAKSNSPGMGQDEHIYYTPTIDGDFCLIITKLVDVSAYYTLINSVYTGDPTDTDSDGLPDEIDSDDDDDGMPDVWENQNGLNPKDELDANDDNDNDNLTNLQEYYGSDGSPAGKDSLDPNNKDTDGDGYDDDGEILAGSNPLDPLDGPISYEHLTTQACAKSYTDPAGDVLFWQMNSTNIYDHGTGRYPDFDIISLDSSRVGENLEVKLKVDGEIQDLDVDYGNYVEFTRYFFYFVDPDYDQTIDDTGVPQMYAPTTYIGLYIFGYYNGTFDGTAKINGTKTSDTLTWIIPLEELIYLPPEFGIFAVCEYIKSDSTAEPNISGAWTYDYAGTGSKEIDEDGDRENETNGDGGDEVLPTETVSETIDDHEIEVSFAGDGEIEINNVTTKPAPSPEDAEDIGVFIDITSKNGTVQNIFITVSYDDNDLPANFSESDLKLFYYDETLAKWVKAENTGVWPNNNTVWARVDHLTIFAPMAQKGAQDEPDEEEGLPMDLIMMILIIVIILIVIFGIIGVVIKTTRKRRKEGYYDERERARAELEYPPEQDAEVEDEVDWAEPSEEQPEAEYKDCPKCDEPIEVPYSEDLKIAIQCGSCGVKGKIPNPYFRSERREERIEKKKKPPVKKSEKVKEEEPEEEEDVDWGEEEEEEEIELKQIKCPKCKGQLEIPYSESKKVKLHCDSCGAKGMVRNPYS